MSTFSDLSPAEKAEFQLDEATRLALLALARYAKEDPYAMEAIAALREAREYGGFVTVLEAA